MQFEKHPSKTRNLQNIKRENIRTLHLIRDFSITYALSILKQFPVDSKCNITPLEGKKYPKRLKKISFIYSNQMISSLKLIQKYTSYNDNTINLENIADIEITYCKLNPIIEGCELSLFDIDQLARLMYTGRVCLQIIDPDNTICIDTQNPKYNEERYKLFERIYEINFKLLLSHLKPYLNFFEIYQKLPYKYSEISSLDSEHKLAINTNTTIYDFIQLVLERTLAYISAYNHTLISTDNCINAFSTYLCNGIKFESPKSIINLPLHKNGIKYRTINHFKQKLIEIGVDENIHIDFISCLLDYKKHIRKHRKKERKPAFNFKEYKLPKEIVEILKTKKHLITISQELLHYQEYLLDYNLKHNPQVLHQSIVSKQYCDENSFEFDFEVDEFTVIAAKLAHYCKKNDIKKTKEVAIFKLLCRGCGFEVRSATTSYRAFSSTGKTLQFKKTQSRRSKNVTLSTCDKEFILKVLTQ